MGEMCYVVVWASIGLRRLELGVTTSLGRCISFFLGGNGVPYIQAGTIRATRLGGVDDILLAWS